MIERHSETADVLVVGGGTAGVVAALQAARAGAKTVLVERLGILGGTITHTRVANLFYFWSRERQIIAGIGEELVSRTLELDGSDWPDFRTPPEKRPQHGVGVNPALYTLVAEEACLEAGVTLHYHEMAWSASPRDDGWRVGTVGKGLARTIDAREVIDCTGDADVVGLAGLERIRHEQRQPGTQMMTLTGYDPAAVDGDLAQRRYEQARREGTLQPGDYWLGDTRPFMGFLFSRGRNSQHVFNADSSTAETQTQANLAGRQAALRLLRFLRTLPGCENARIEWLAGDVAVRETWQIVGETTITHQDYVTGRRFDDAVCYSFYFIDVHTEGGVEHEFLPPETVPTVPLGALVPRGSRHLLVAGRCLASDRKAMSALRVEASCMAMGQAAGAAAALGVRLGVPSRDVPLDALRALLAEHGAIVP